MPSASARVVWKLARRHSWGAPIPADELVELVAKTDDHDTLARILESEVLERRFVARSREGVFIPNGQDAHVAAADWLRANTSLDDLQIEATLSRLPDDWPSAE